MYIVYLSLLTSYANMPKKKGRRKATQAVKYKSRVISAKTLHVPSKTHPLAWSGTVHHQESLSTALRATMNNPEDPYPYICLRHRTIMQHPAGVETATRCTEFQGVAHHECYCKCVNFGYCGASEYKRFIVYSTRPVLF